MRIKRDQFGLKATDPDHIDLGHYREDDKTRTYDTKNGAMMKMAEIQACISLYTKEFKSPPTSILLPYSMAHLMLEVYTRFKLKTGVALKRPNAIQLTQS